MRMRNSANHAWLCQRVVVDASKWRHQLETGHQQSFDLQQDFDRTVSMRDVYRQVHVRLRNELTQSVHWGACGKLLTLHGSVVQKHMQLFLWIHVHVNAWTLCYPCLLLATVDSDIRSGGWRHEHDNASLLESYWPAAVVSRQSLHWVHL